MKIKDLRKAIANLPDDGEVYIQRIEDVYFKEHGWKTIPMKGEHYWGAVQWNKDIDSGKYLDKEEYPDIDPEKHLKKLSEEDLNSMLEQYIDTECCINYDGKNLYITSHY
jgi:hypothetical protein